MAANEPTTSRRALLGALVTVPLLAAPVAAAAAPGVDEVLSHLPTDGGPDAYALGWKYGEKSATDITLCYVARAWIDRWKAAGGDFGVQYKPSGSFGSLLIGSVESDFWWPTDEGNENLKPHLWLLDRKHQPGAIKVLEAMLTLVPGLHDKIEELVGSQIIAGGRV